MHQTTKRFKDINASRSSKLPLPPSTKHNSSLARHTQRFSTPLSHPPCIAHTQCASRARPQPPIFRTPRLRRRRPNPAACSEKPTSVRMISLVFRFPIFHLRRQRRHLQRLLYTHQRQLRGGPTDLHWRRGHVVPPEYTILDTFPYLHKLLMYVFRAHVSQINGWRFRP